MYQKAIFYRVYTLYIYERQTERTKMSIAFANSHIAEQKLKLEGQLKTHAAKHSKAIQTAQNSYKEKYGDASIFDVARAQQNINTQSAYAQTPQQQTQMQAGGTENMINALLKLQNVISNITTAFHDLAHHLKTQIYALSTQDAGQQSPTPKDNIGTNNQGAQGQQKTVKQDEKAVAGSTTEVVDKNIEEQDPNNNPTNENEAKTSKQLDREFINKIMIQREKSFTEGTKKIDENIPDIEAMLAGVASTTGTST